MVRHAEPSRAPHSCRASDGFEDGTTGAWSASRSADHPLLVRQTFVYGGRGGRVSRLQTTVGSDLVSQSYSWDALGLLTQVGYPDMAGYTAPPQAIGSVTNSYTNGFLTGVGGFASSLAYHPNGALQKVSHDNGVEDVH